MRSKYAIPVAAAALVASCWIPALAQAEPTTPPGPPPGPTAEAGAAEAGPAPGPDAAEGSDAAVTDDGIPGTGTFEVGKDVVPGTYSSGGPVDEESTCYWKRSSGDELIDNAMTKKPQIVKIEATDTSFRTSDCQPWQKIEDCLPGCGPAQVSTADLLGQLGRIMMNKPPAG